MSAISNNDIAHAIYLASKDETQAKQFSGKVIRFLSKKRLWSKYPDILSCLDKIINENEGRIAVKVSSVKKINENAKKEIIHFLSSRYGKKEVSLKEVLDEKLLGGFKIEANDEIIDLTMRNKIEKLQEYLTKSR
ncbi:MAG: F0F1 ATP synthase subunit delta [Minisyncoccia bacterium]